MRFALLAGSSNYQDGYLIADGDSITRAFGLAPNESWFSRAVASSTLSDLNFDSYNSGVDSATVADMLGNVTTEVDAKYRDSARFIISSTVGNIAILFGGTNDMYFGADETTTRQRQLNWLAGRRAAGFKTLIGTMLRRNPLDVPVNFETYRQTNVAFWRANWQTYCDGLIDWCDDAAALDVTNLTYYQDAVHPTAALALIMGEDYAAHAIRQVITG